jgi:hypothetical protein
VQQGLWKGGAFIQVKADAPKEEVKEAPAEKAKDPEKKKKKKKH